MKKNNKKGFTLVELVIVVAVMAILVAVAIPTVSSITTSAKNSVNESNARTIESMLKLAEAENNDGEVLTEQEVFNAIYNAKLGIETGNFVYDTTAGTVKSGTGTASATVYTIKFATAATSGSTTSLEVKGDSTVNTYAE